MKSTYFVKTKDLIAEIFIIGYPCEGESQIFILKEKNRILFSCVIDCCEGSNSRNATASILESIGVKSLDMLIWTHTDEDHSLGIDTIADKFCTNDTDIILPEFITGLNNDIINYSKRIKDTFSLFENNNTGSNYNVSTASVKKGHHSVLHDVDYIDINSNTSISFVISAIAPCSALLRRRNQSGANINKNDFSIATIFNIGNIKILFSADIEDQTIRTISDCYFTNLSFIKTAHHTSTSSTLLVRKVSQNLRTKIPTAVTTVFKKSNLPHISVVNSYKNYVDNFYSTGVGNIADCGITKTIFDISNNLIIGEFLSGNAVPL